jgi:hypothetical protein
MQLNREEIVNSENKWESPESRNSRENINSIFLELIDFLVPLQLAIRNNITIDNKWRISRSKLALIKNAYLGSEIINWMDDSALTFFNSLWEENKWFTDCCIIMWALIFVYNSQVEVPDLFKGLDRWNHKYISKSWKPFSVIWIDVNPERRKDWVKAETSLHHELQHQLNTTIWDQFLVENNTLNFISADRNIEIPRWYSNRCWYVANDTTKISELFWRTISFNAKHRWMKTQDYEDYENQLYYLDELSANFWQAKGNIFGPKQLFYNNVTPWEKSHYELIWDNPNDKKDLQELFRNFIMQWFYLFELIKLLKKEIQELLLVKEIDNIDNLVKLEKIKEYENKIINLNELIAIITQSLWVSRTVHQALELMKIVWVKRISPRLSTDYLEYIATCSKLLHEFL